MPSQDLTRLTIRQVSRLIKRRQVSCVEVTDAAFRRIDHANGRLNAFITLLADEAKAEAEQADALLSKGVYNGPLHGIPMSLKDLYDTKGVRTTSATRLMVDHVPTEDSGIARRLRDAGAILIGKANMTEFALGGIWPEYGQAINPWHAEHTPGGSSSGSGVSVASGMNYASIGSDTGGSIRIPSAFCGVVGLKPTFGRVSRRGMGILSWTLDHAGPLTRSVGDAALVLQAIAGRDPRDPSSSNERVPSYPMRPVRSLEGMTIGIPWDYYYEELHPEVERALRRAHRELRSLGAGLRRVTIPHADEASAAQMIIMYAEGGAINRKALAERPEDFTEQVQGMFHQGLMTSAVTYLGAQRARSLVIEEFQTALRHVDALVMPTVPIPPQRLGERPVAGDGTPVVGRCTIVGTMTGLPALSVPCGFTKNGLPMGMQCIGRPFDEATILEIGHAYESATEWHTRVPPGLE